MEPRKRGSPSPAHDGSPTPPAGLQRRTRRPVRARRRSRSSNGNRDRPSASQHTHGATHRRSSSDSAAAAVLSVDQAEGYSRVRDGAFGAYAAPRGPTDPGALVLDAGDGTAHEPVAAAAPGGGMYAAPGHEPMVLGEEAATAVPSVGEPAAGARPGVDVCLFYELCNHTGQLANRLALDLLAPESYNRAVRMFTAAGPRVCHSCAMWATRHGHRDKQKHKRCFLHHDGVARLQPKCRDKSKLLQEMGLHLQPPTGPCTCSNDSCSKRRRTSPSPGRLPGEGMVDQASQTGPELAPSLPPLRLLPPSPAAPPSSSTPTNAGVPDVGAQDADTDDMGANPDINELFKNFDAC